MSEIQYQTRVVAITTVYIPIELAIETKQLGINRSRVLCDALEREVLRVRKQRADPNQQPRKPGSDSTPEVKHKGGD